MPHSTICFFNCILGTGAAGNTVDSNSELSRNILYFTLADNPASFHHRVERVGAGLDYNLYYHEKGGAKKLLQEQRKKDKANNVDVHSVAADPLFVDLVHGDFSFKAGSPAITL
ncbi:MAG: hypothetical protein V5783_11240 [Pontiella sp.]